MIDEDGYRFNVGIILCNHQGQLLWAKRIRQDAWQFPQGGINQGESVKQALYRELTEETGLKQQHVKVLGCTRGWLRYRLPQKMIRVNNSPVCIGQKQKWYLLKLVADESHIQLDITDKPEFDHWKWVTYWYPLKQVVPFKRNVYLQALKELSPKIIRLQHLNQ
jgi:putative (di)nucleoside polyphosphate hydrolase